MPPFAPLAERFARHFIPEPMSGCWLWTAGINVETGYGAIGLGPPTRGTDCAHRVSWTLHRGAIPHGLLVLHKCDVRCCVNPDHLFLGTHADNCHDKIAKGRARYVPLLGEQHGGSKLTEHDVRGIRTAIDDGGRTAVLARRYGVTPTTISEIKYRKTWGHL